MLVFCCTAHTLSLWCRGWFLLGQWVVYLTNQLISLWYSQRRNSCLYLCFNSEKPKSRGQRSWFWCCWPYIGSSLHINTRTPGVRQVIGDIIRPKLTVKWPPAKSKSTLISTVTTNVYQAVNLLHKPAVFWKNMMIYLDDQRNCTMGYQWAKAWTMHHRTGSNNCQNNLISRLNTVSHKQTEYCIIL